MTNWIDLKKFIVENTESDDDTTMAEMDRVYQEGGYPALVGFMTTHDFNLWDLISSQPNKVNINFQKENYEFEATFTTDLTESVILFNSESFKTYSVNKPYAVLAFTLEAWYCAQIGRAHV